MTADLPPRTRYPTPADARPPPLMMLPRCLRKRRAAHGARNVRRGASTRTTVERDAAALEIVGGTMGCALDLGGTARGTDQRFLVPIRSDQNQGFRCPVLLDAPASHETALLAGFDGTKVAYPCLRTIYRVRGGYAKVCPIASQ